MAKNILFLSGAFLLSALSLFAQDQTGTASFYGDEFTGRKTSSGALYDPALFTAAHLTLPFGTKVEVTNLDNGLKTTVTVNDRGPWVKGRLIDLSRAAAEALRIDGLAQVSIHPTGEVDPALAVPAAVAESPTVVYFQAGAFHSLANARTQTSNLGKTGFTVEIWAEGDVYRVYVLRTPGEGTEGTDKFWLKISGFPPGKPLS